MCIEHVKLISLRNDFRFTVHVLFLILVLAVSAVNYFNM